MSSSNVTRFHQGLTRRAIHSRIRNWKIRQLRACIQLLTSMGGGAGNFTPSIKVALDEAAQQAHKALLLIQELEQERMTHHPKCPRRGFDIWDAILPCSCPVGYAGQQDRNLRQGEDIPWNLPRT